jgi:hypothetical protein
MDLNSEEFYKQKYLKYKHKYLEAQKLYGEELEGGGTNYWLIVPIEIYNEYRLILKKGGKYTKDSALFLLLGMDSHMIKTEDTKILSSFTKDDIRQIDTKLGIVEKKYNDDNAIKQLRVIYSDKVLIKINSSRFSEGGDIYVVDMPSTQ